jgi:hypothetical protein
MIPILSVDDPRLAEKTLAMQRRRRVLAILGHRFAAAMKPHVGKPAPFNQGPLKDMLWTFFVDGSQNTCTSVNAVVMAAAGASGGWAYAISSNPGYVEFAEGRRPSVGDTFNLKSNTDETQHHSGIIVKVAEQPGDFWLTADGGQGYPEFGRDSARPPNQKEAAYIVPRSYYCADTSMGHQLRLNHYCVSDIAQGGERLSGWVDISHPAVQFKYNAAFDNDGSEDDYKDFVRRIREVTRLAPEAFAFYQDKSNPTFRT